MNLAVFAHLSRCSQGRADNDTPSQRGHHRQNDALALKVNLLDGKILQYQNLRRILKVLTLEALKSPLTAPLPAIRPKGS